MACTDLDFLWRDYFRDPSQFQDNRSSKRGARSPDFRHIETRKPLWLNARRNPPWVKEELRIRGLHYHGQASLPQESQDLTALFNLIKTCGLQKNLHKGNLLYVDILARGLLAADVSLGNALLSMFLKCGALTQARELFDQLSARNVVTWNALIAGYAQHGLGNEALHCFQRMQDEGVSPNTITFLCALKACSSIRALERGEEIHAEVSRQGLLLKHCILDTALLDMYAKCGALAKAQGVFDVLPIRDVVMWNALIAGYAQHGHGDEALRCFRQMQDEGLSPDAVTFISTLKACGSIGAVDVGEEIHAKVSKQVSLQNNVVLGTTLIDMWAKCGVLPRAQEVFDKLPTRNVVTWNALISGYAEHGLADEALSSFQRMQDGGLSPNGVTLLCTLKACGSLGAMEKGEEIHMRAHRLGLLEKDIMMGNAVVDMYAKCGALAKAQKVFEELPRHNLITWNALLAGYAQQELADEALYLYERMQADGFFPDEVTYTCVLKACGSLGAVEKGEKIHQLVGEMGLMSSKDVVLGNALVDMYAKCGDFAKAQGVFDKLHARDAATWTALMTGYAQVGDAKRVIDFFFGMIRDGFEPNVVTFVVVLTVCSHAGLLEEGQLYFDSMTTGYCVNPTFGHCICMVDLFSRAGCFAEAITFIEKVPTADRLLLWSALMGACKKWVNVELGRWAFEHAVQLDETFTPAYICMTHIYASASMLQETSEVEAKGVD